MPKPLLRFGDTTFLERIVSVLEDSGVDRITVVLGSQAETIRASVDLSRVDVVVNNDYLSGQLSSLIAGLRRVPPETSAILLCLVDNPLITTDVIGQIALAFRKTGSPIVLPVFDGRRGHPALFARSVFEELLQAPADEGARHVVYANEDSVLEVAVDEEAVLASIDTPGDYLSHFGTEPQVISREKP